MEACSMLLVNMTLVPTKSALMKQLRVQFSQILITDAALKESLQNDQLYSRQSSLQKNKIKSIIIYNRVANATEKEDSILVPSQGCCGPGCSGTSRRSPGSAGPACARASARTPGSGTRTSRRWSLQHTRECQMLASTWGESKFMHFTEDQVLRS